MQIERTLAAYEAALLKLGAGLGDIEALRLRTGVAQGARVANQSVSMRQG